MKPTHNHAVVVAGGSGTRMGSRVPKQFLLLKGQPILMHTLEAFHFFDPQISITLVLPKAQISHWKVLCATHHFNLPHRVVAGGASRSASVHNGLRSLPDEYGIVAIHDGVRPFCDAAMLQRGFAKAAHSGCAVAAVALKDSIRKTEDNDNTQTADRNRYRLVQTPQLFDLQKIKAAHKMAANAPDMEFTDDAAVWEYAGHRVSLFEGSYRNIKITTAEDLMVAEVFINTAF